MKFFLLILLLVPDGRGELFAQQRYSISGTVRDAQTGEPLSAATIRILGSSKGTISNASGAYSVPLDTGRYALVFSYLAYQPETVIVRLDRNVVREVALRSSPIQFPEFVVLAEDPAVEIIRKAIANKRKWMDQLRSYRFEAFTRQVLRRDTAIAGITESYTTGFMKSGDTLREIIRQRRQTQNVPSEDNLAAVRRIVNFNEDEISLFSLRVDGKSSAYVFTGPTAPNALDDYDYKLLKTSRRNGLDVYEIKMTPKSRLKPLFDGTIMIADQTFAVMGVDVRPNEAFTIPFVRDIDLRYRQQFALYDSLFWMPTDIRIAGALTVSIVGISLPRIGIEATSSMYEYAINAPLPDSVFHRPSVTVDSSATKFDSTYWRSRTVLPLTGEEQAAFQTLDSTETLEKQFRPKGPLAFVGGEGGGSLPGTIDARFNRVEGFYLGTARTFNHISPLAEISAAAGYAFSAHRFEGRAGVSVFTSPSHALGLSVEYHDAPENVPDGDFYGPFVISLMALLDKNDYRDYYRARGTTISVVSRPSRRLQASIGFTTEREFTEDVRTDYSFFNGSRPYRANPSILEGTFNSIIASARFGREEAPLDLIPRNAIEFSMEVSEPRFTGGDVSFTRFSGTATWNIETFARALLLSPTLRMRLSGGLLSRIDLPQRLFSVDSRSSGYAAFGVLKGGGVHEFSGNRFVALNVEHDFRSVPFLLLGLPWFHRNHMGFIVHGSAAQTWFDGKSSSDGWYTEAGAGIGGILDLLRVDCTYRFHEPRQWGVTMSLATIF